MEENEAKLKYEEPGNEEGCEKKEKKEKKVEDDREVRYDDRETICFLIMREHRWVRKERVGNRIVFYFKAQEIEESIGIWNSPDPINVPDLRKFLTAIRIFNSVIHDSKWQ
ncbi:MAG: hypothetical protein WBP54_04275 [Pelodictyon phaeoclathratiforme]